jgi:uncharacterized ferredoxin-like protein
MNTLRCPACGRESRCIATDRLACGHCNQSFWLPDTAWLRESHAKLLAACKAFDELWLSCDMRPEDECHEVAATVRAAIAFAEPQEPIR